MKPMHTKIAAVLIALLLADGAAAAQEAAPSGTVDAGTAPADGWPLLGCNVQRHGATPTEIHPPFRRKWYRSFADEGLMMGVQPVIADGRVFIGTMRGILHAIDDATGRDLWTYAVPFGIFHSPAVADATVYVCGGDGKLHAVDVATGQPRWVYDTGSNVALWNSPLPWNGNVFFGGRDGFLYAVRAADGELAWRQDLGAPIVQSPAIDPAAGRLYVGAEDMRAYALRTENGQVLWVSEQLNGFTFAGYYPVVTPGGGVVFTTCPFNAGTWMGPLEDATFNELLIAMHGPAVAERFPGEKLPAFPSWHFSAEQNRQFHQAVLEAFRQPGFQEREFGWIRQRFAADPRWRTVFLLDGQTGRERGVVPVLYGESNTGPTAPPIVLADDRVVLIAVASVPNDRSRDLAWLDPNTGDLELIQPPAEGHPHGTGLTLINDEMTSLTGAGAVVVMSRQDAVQGFDTSDRRRNLAGPWWKGIHVPTETERRLPLLGLRGGTLPVGREHVVRGTGVYGGGSGIDVASPVAGRSFYYISRHEANTGSVLVACEMTDQAEPLAGELEVSPVTDADARAVLDAPWDFDALSHARTAVTLAELGLHVPGTIGHPDPAGQGAGRKPTDAELERILFEASRVTVGAGAAPQLREKLARSVAELVSARWAPLASPESRSAATLVAFDDPSEIYYTLGLAWPYLPVDLQAQVRQYVNQRLRSGELDRDRLALADGEARERYVTRLPYRREVAGLVRPTGLARLYPVWCYAHAADDWEWIEANWPRIRSLAAGASPGEWARDGRNAYLTGLIAYCRIAAHMKDEGALRAGQAAALAAMRDRIEYEATYARGGVFHFESLGKWRSGAARWFFLTPETARLCRTYAGPVQDALVARYIDHQRPSWYLAWGPLITYGQENWIDHPIHGFCHFQAKALLTDTPPDELAHYVDVPWCRADLYYITKLALAIRGQGQPDWADVRN